MISVHIDAAGLMAACAEAETQIATQVRRAVDLGSHMIAATARKTNRYNDRSGHLRASTTTAPVETSGDVITGTAQAGASSIVFYAKFIEDGTRNIAPRKFMAAAAEENQAAIEGVVADSIELALLNAGFTR